MDGDSPAWRSKNKGYQMLSVDFSLSEAQAIYNAAKSGDHRGSAIVYRNAMRKLSRAIVVRNVQGPRGKYKPR